jgi:hypothetical protein
MNHKTVVAPRKGGKLPPIPYRSRVYADCKGNGNTPGMLYLPLLDTQDRTLDRLYRLHRQFEVAHELRELRKGNDFMHQMRVEVDKLNQEREEMRAWFLSLGCPGIKPDMDLKAMRAAFEQELRKMWTWNAQLGAKLDRMMAKHPYTVA